MTKRKTRALICDLDMTLIDSKRDIAMAAMYAVSQCAGRKLSEEKVARWIGKDLRKMFQGLLPDLDGETIEKIISTYRTRFFDNCAIHTRLYPGVERTLKTIRNKGFLLAIATAKRPFMAKRVSEVFGLDRLVDHVQGTEGFPEKPAPAILILTCKELGIDPTEAVFAGDTIMDIQAAKNAGCGSVAITYGIGAKEELLLQKPDVLIDSFEDIIKVIEG